MKKIKLGLMIGYSGAQMNLPMDKIKLAEDLGYDSVWTAEAYGSDAVTPLAYIAAHTKRIRLGTAIMQMAGRSPTMAAMQAATVDALAGGNRFIAGIGMSGPQIVEGWYGQPWGKPYHWMKDYITIMRKVFARDAPVTHDGQQLPLPLPADRPGAMGIGKPLKSILHTNPNIPIWTGSGTETMVKLTAQLADGWLPLGWTPRGMELYGDWLREGFAKAGNGKSMDNFEIQAGVGVHITDDVKAGLAVLKPTIALYAGGMGHKDKNFHKDRMVKFGYGDAADRIQELYLAGRKEEAAAAVPDEYVDEQNLVGPEKRIRQNWAAWADSGATGISIGTRQTEAIHLMADIAGSKENIAAE
jgi:F420-dependent oxidoreductase-like protein